MLHATNKISNDIDISKAVTKSVLWIHLQAATSIIISIEIIVPKQWKPLQYQFESVQKMLVHSKAQRLPQEGIVSIEGMSSFYYRAVMQA